MTFLHRLKAFLAWLDSLLGDVRYGARVLSQDRAYSLLAILILTIGIAGTTAMYSFVHGIQIRPLPYGNPEAVVGLRGANLVGVRRASNIEQLFAYEYAEMAGLDTVFDDVAFYRPERIVLDEIRYPAYVNETPVSPLRESRIPGMCLSE